MAKSVKHVAIAAALLASTNAFAQTTAPAEATGSPETSATPTLPAWLNKISLGGDIRFRLNQINDNSAQNTAEYVRARLALTGKVNDSFTGNLRFASAAASNTITSSNQELGSFEGKKDLWLDIASLDWKAFPGLTVTAGKALNPFYSAGKNEMIWDSDVTLEGAQVKYSQEFGSLKPFVNVVHSIVKEQSTGAATSADVTLLGAQLGFGFKSDLFGATLAASSYTFNNMKGLSVGTNSAPTAGIGPRGNSATGGAYDFEYKMTNVELEVTTNAVGIPLTGYGAWVQNSDPSEMKDGYLGGLRLGGVKDVNSWSLDYNYRDLGKDATVGQFTDGDFAGGGTQVRGHKIGAQYVVAPSTTLALTSIFANKGAASTYYERYIVEALVAF